jgi:hypothetical protein
MIEQTKLYLLTEERKQFIRQWLQNLRSGEFEQTTTRLAQKKVEAEPTAVIGPETYKFCVLGLLAFTTGELELDRDALGSPFIDLYGAYYKPVRAYGSLIPLGANVEGEAATIIAAIGQRCNMQPREFHGVLTTFNDDEQMSFSSIAFVIEQLLIAGGIELL